MFNNPFSFDGRIRRTEFGISIIIFIAAQVVIGLIIEANSRHSYNGDNNIRLLGLLMLPMLWFLFAQAAKRSHDAGHSGWMQLIPFWYLIILFMEGTQGQNQYGQDPKATNNNPPQQQYLQNNNQNYNQNNPNNNSANQNYNPNGGYQGGYQGGHNNSGQNNYNNNYNPNQNNNNSQQYNQNSSNQNNNNGNDEYKSGDLYK